MSSQRQSGNRSRELWEAMLRVTPLPPERSSKELRDLAARGQAANAIVAAFVRDLATPLDAPDFTAHLETFEQQGSRDLTRNGYRLRLAERDVISKRMLIPLGQIESILCSSMPPQEKTAAVAEYLDSHETVGLGDPVRLYVLASFDEIRGAFDDLSQLAIDANRPYIGDLEMQSELYCRYIAYGYVYRIAEELVLQGLPADWKSDDASLAAPEPVGDGSEPTPLWIYFQGKPNTAPVLFEKAKIITRLIDTIWSDGLILSAPIRGRDVNSVGRLEEDQARKVISENAALFLRIVDEIAFLALGADLSDEFMDALIAFVERDVTGRGVQPELFAKCLKERRTEYADYSRWVPTKNESGKGTLLWEFAKKIADIVGIGGNAIFNSLLTYSLVEMLATWRLRELLQGADGQQAPPSPA